MRSEGYGCLEDIPRYVRLGITRRHQAKQAENQNRRYAWGNLIFLDLSSLIHKMGINLATIHKLSLF